MCLVTKDSTVYTAEEDITVYKLLHVSGASMYQDFKYTLGMLYQTDMVLRGKNGGGWCYFDGVVEKHYRIDLVGHDIDDYTVVNEGFHSIISKERADRIFKYTKAHVLNSVLYECTIPKGAKYYKDATGLAVSDSIIVNKAL